MRHIDDIPVIKTKNNFVKKNTSFPSAIIVWNKLDFSIWNAESFVIFKNNTLKFIRPTLISFLTVITTKELD